MRTWASQEKFQEPCIAKSRHGFLIRIQRNVLGNPEIQQLRSAVRKHDVAWASIPMNNSNLMKRFSAESSGQRNLPSLLSGQGTALQAPRQDSPSMNSMTRTQTVLLSAMS